MCEIDMNDVYYTNKDKALEPTTVHPMEEKELIKFCIDNLVRICHGAAYTSGWWTNLKTGEDLVETGNYNVPEKLMLIVSEVAEAMEGHRKNLMDDKLPERKMIEVELADAIIRIFDTAGALKLDIGGATGDKLEYNLNRADHKPENRVKDGGKAY